MDRPPNDSTAIAFEVPEDMSEEQRRRLIQRVQSAMRNEGIEGRVLWCHSYASDWGSPVFYQP